MNQEKIVKIAEKAPQLRHDRSPWSVRSGGHGYRCSVDIVERRRCGMLARLKSLRLRAWCGSDWNHINYSDTGICLMPHLRCFFWRASPTPEAVQKDGFDLWGLND